MAMIDMSLVTSTLVRLLDEHVPNSSAWNPAIVLNVTPDPPDKLTGDNTLGLYLHPSFGMVKAEEFLGGYLLEKSLSVDNLFVFVLIFAYFKTAS